MNGGTKWTYKSKAVLNEKSEQIEKIVFNDDGSKGGVEFLLQGWRTKM